MACILLSNRGFPMSGDRKSHTGHGSCPYPKPKPKFAKSRTLSYRSSRGIRRREHGRRDPSEPGQRARRGPRAPLDGRARRVRGRAPAHGPRVRGGFHPAAGRVVRPGAGRVAQEEPYCPMGLRQGGAQGAEHGRTRLQPHEAPPQGRYDRLDATFLANLQLILIAVYLKNTAKNPTSVNTP